MGVWEQLKARLLYGSNSNTTAGLTRRHEIWRRCAARAKWIFKNCGLASQWTNAGPSKTAQSAWRHSAPGPRQTCLVDCRPQRRSTDSRLLQVSMNRKRSPDSRCG